MFSIKNFLSVIVFIVLLSISCSSDADVANEIPEIPKVEKKLVKLNSKNAKNKIGPYLSGLKHKLKLSNKEIEQVRSINSRYAKNKKIYNRLKDSIVKKDNLAKLEKKTKNEYVALLGKIKVQKKEAFDLSWKNRKK